MNPSLEMEGVVFTMYDARTNLSLEVVENVKNNLNEKYIKQLYHETYVWRRLQVTECRLIFMTVNRQGQKATGS